MERESVCVCVFFFFVCCRKFVDFDRLLVCYVTQVIKFVE